MSEHLAKALAELHWLQLRHVRLCQLSTEPEMSPVSEEVELHLKGFCTISQLLRTRQGSQGDVSSVLPPCCLVLQ